MLDIYMCVCVCVCVKLVLGQGMSGALLAKLWLVYPPLFSLSRQVEELESFEL